MAVALQLVPDSFNLSSFTFDFSQKSQTKGLIYIREGYIHKITVTKNEDNTVIIDARCYRSTRKGETPHRLHVDLAESVVKDAYCSCTAG